ncbi:hypothetical protein [Nocardia panacis]|uniref:hypothetical protein n=1 Tax=Nocardia panacis TaxID=2340916 RepID=UPI0011C3814B|nr:hypothetical protein [Nocardia panacis]
MSIRHNNFDELGAKVQRAQQALQQIRGVGVVNGIRVTVDAENRLLSITVHDEATILAAYQAAILDKQPRFDDAMRELRADPSFEATSTFVEANKARRETENVQQQRNFEEDDDQYFADRNRQGWLDR